MKKIYLFFTCFALSLILLVPLDAASIVFIHIGEEIPDYVETAIDQAKLFNPQSALYLIGNEQAIQNWGAKDRVAATLVACETIPFSDEHASYILKNLWSSHFWRYTSERFLYLYDFVNYYQLENVFHLENDVMLYADVENMLPALLEKYKGIAAPFDNDDRCIPGFVFIPNASILKSLAQCFVDTAKKCLNDMQVLAVFKNTKGPSFIDHLPIILNEYIACYPLVSPSKRVAKNPYKYSQHIDVFNSIFDAAALGQYLGGIDPRNGPPTPGFINESCVFNPSYMTYEWKKDKYDRLVPYMAFKGKKIRINNLHIHSKRLALFSSRNLF